MKRSPLTRSTPLRRGPGPRKQSRRRKAEAPARAACIAIVRARSGGRCEARFSQHCTGWGCDGHELRKSSQGGSRTDPANVLFVCRFCNSQIEDEPIRAHDMGLVIWREDLPVCGICGAPGCDLCDDGGTL